MRRKLFLKNIITILLLTIISINIIACGLIENTKSGETIESIQEDMEESTEVSVQQEE